MWKIYQTYNWKELENKFSWINEMQHVPQDPIYHAEGNVAIHTQMVLSELMQLPEFKELDEQNRHILLAAALMHDIENVLQPNLRQMIESVQQIMQKMENTRLEKYFTRRLKLPLL